MSINLDKNRDELVSAWKDVLDEKTSTNWTLFTYEGQTNILKFVSKGSDGIEELIDDLNSGKIMYAFVKINDPKTQLDKFVLINWQGEGANTLRKGISANHLRDIEKFFSGAHITISARNEEEVEPQLIIDKVAKSGSAYSFKTIKPEALEPTGPVGTTYQRVNPIKEINSRERDQFWRKEEEEEKRRVAEELLRKEEERLKAEEELKKRELEEEAKREAETTERNNYIDRIKMAEVEQTLQPVQPQIIEEPKRNNQSDVLRQQRKQEAQELIAQRTIDARSVFEQNTIQTAVKKIPEKPVRASILKAQQAAEEAKNNNLRAPSPKDEISDEETDQFSTIKRSPKDPEKKQQPTTPPSEPVKEEIVAQITDQQFVDEYLYCFSTPGLQARALYDYQAADDTEITFDPGDVITNIDQVDEGWWQGLAPNGTYGLFPANYVELLK